MQRTQNLREIPILPIEVDRVQTGVRIERRLLETLRDLAEWRGWPLGKLMEELALHALAGPISGEWAFTPGEMSRIPGLMAKHGIDYDLYSVHLFEDRATAGPVCDQGVTDDLWERVRQLRGRTLETATGRPFEVADVTSQRVTVRPLAGRRVYAISRTRFNAVMKLGLRQEEMTAQRLSQARISLPVYKIAILKAVLSSPAEPREAPAPRVRPGEEDEARGVGPVWQRIVQHAGETFRQVRGAQFTYRVDGNQLRLDRTNQSIARSVIGQALAFVPMPKPSCVQHLRAPSYLYAILMDPRIRDGVW